MRTFRIVLAAAVAALLVVTVADPAAAKGPRGATIDGPGLDAPIDDPDVGSSKLPALTGLYGALWADPWIPLSGEAPTEDLGPAWVITWNMGSGPGGGPGLVEQTVYLYARSGPLVHTEAGQPFYDQATVGGWYEAPSALRSMLVMLGLPSSDPSAAAPAPPAEPDVVAATGPVTDDPPTAWIALAGPLALLVIATPLALRRHHRTRAAHPGGERSRSSSARR